MLSKPDFKEKHAVLVFAKDGQKLSFKNDNLVVKDSDGKIVLQVTCYKLFSVWIIGNINITSGLLERSKKYCFSITLFSYGFKPYGQWNAATEGNFLLRQIQYTSPSLAITQRLVHNKIMNQQGLLKTIRDKNQQCKDAITKIGEYAQKVHAQDDLNSILGLEGSASRLYFGVWFAGQGWKGRKPRAKIDPINVLMDIGYTLLFNFIEALLNLYGFDVYKGVYHQNFYQRKSLVCDLVEPFRVIVDKTIKKGINLGQMKEEDFLQIKGKYVLNYKDAKPYTKWLLEGILEYKEEMFTYVQLYYRSFMRQKEQNDYPFFNIKLKDITYENISNV